MNNQITSKELLEYSRDINLNELEKVETYSNVIKTSIRNIVLHTTQYVLGDDPLRGTDLVYYIGKQLDPTTISSMKLDIRQSIIRSEPRVSNININIINNSEFGSIVIVIEYQVIETDIIDTLRLNYKLDIR